MTDYKNTDKNLNKIRGNRLKRCRELRKLTQAQLADTVGFTDKYINMLENGNRPIDWNKANTFSKVLDVSAEYLMGQTDVVSCSYNSAAIISDSFTARDHLFLKSLEATGHSIVFKVVNFHDTDRSLHNISLSMISEFSLSDIHCTYTDVAGIKHESIIKEVELNAHTISFAHFVFLINRLYDYTDYTLNSIQDFYSDLSVCNAYELMATSEIAETHLGDMGQLEFMEKLKSGKTVEIDLGNGLKGYAQLGDSKEFEL